MAERTPPESQLLAQLDDLNKALSTVTGLSFPKGAEFHLLKYNEDFQQFCSSSSAQCESLLDRLASFFPQGRPRDLDPADQAFTDPEAAYSVAERTIDGRLDKLATALSNLRDLAKGTAAVDPGSALVAAAATGTLPAPTRATAAASAKKFDVVGAGPRPQAFFEEPVDNSNKAFEPRPWYERVRDSGGASSSSSSALLDLRGTPLAPSTEPIGFKGYHQHPQQAYPHPYGAQLEGLAYPPHLLEKPERAQAFKGLEATPFQFIDTERGLEEAAERLRQATEVAVDLEHHSYRSFQGMTCLLQISTRTEDLVIDALALRAALPAALGPIFADPKIVKVLHGADMDVLWLQRDFGIYVVNMFDTGQAARVLEFPSFSLAFLLQHFCQLEADKTHQLSDWRARPLPEDMLHYARLDTHCLLYIYDRLRMLLHEQGAKIPAHVEVPLPDQHATGKAAVAAPPALLTVLERSRRVCLQLYQKELWTEESYLDLLVQYQLTTLQKEQIAVFAALAQWRDETARRLDESLGFVMSKALLAKLAKEPPTSLKGLRMAVGALSKVAKDSAAVLLRLIETAKAKADDYTAVPQRLLQHKVARDAALHAKQEGTAAGDDDDAPAAAPSAAAPPHAPTPALPAPTAVLGDAADPTVSHTAAAAEQKSSFFEKLKARTAAAAVPAVAPAPSSAFASVFGGAPPPPAATTAQAAAPSAAKSAFAAAFGRSAAAAPPADTDKVQQIRASLSMQQKFTQFSAVAAAQVANTSAAGKKGGEATATNPLAGEQTMEEEEDKGTQAVEPEEEEEEEIEVPAAPKVDERAARADAQKAAQEQEGLDFLPIPLSERARDERRGGAGAGAGKRKRETYEDLAARAVGLTQDEEEGGEERVRDVVAFDYDQLRKDKEAAKSQGKGKGSERPPKKSRLKVYDHEEVKGGKARSKTWVKSGNRSATFRN